MGVAPQSAACVRLTSSRPLEAPLHGSLLRLSLALLLKDTAGMSPGTCLDYPTRMRWVVLPILLVWSAPTLADQAAAQSDDRAEIWVQPLGSLLYGAVFQSPYVSLGATVRLPHQWELVFETSFQYAPSVGDGDGADAPTSDWQLWLSVGAVHFFHAGRPRDGFLLGAKLEGTFQRLEPVPPGTPSDANGFPPQGANAGAFTIDWEAGYRFQFPHFALTLIFPSLGLGYAWNATVLLSPYLVYAQQGWKGFSMSLDINMLRLGVTF
jgi:hypothetical protein